MEKSSKEEKCIALGKGKPFNSATRAVEPYHRQENYGHGEMGETTLEKSGKLAERRLS